MTTTHSTITEWDLVSIIWVDAFDGDTGWTEVEEYEAEECLCVSVGFVWPEVLEGYITLVSGFIIDDEEPIRTVSNVAHIPTSMVRQIKHLGVSTKKLCDTVVVPSVN